MLARSCSSASFLAPRRGQLQQGHEHAHPGPLFWAPADARGALCQASAHGHVAVTWATTPLLLCPTLVPGWLTHHIAHLPAPPSTLPFLTPLPSQKRAPSPGRKQAHAQPGSHGLKMPANSGVGREKEPPPGGSEGPGLHGSRLTLSPPLGLRAGALETQKWGQRGALKESLSITPE